MPGDGEKLASLYVEVEARQEKLRSQMEEIRKFISNRAQAMEEDFKKRKISFDDTLMKKKVSELIELRAKLQAQFDKRVELDFDAQSIKQSRDQLAAVDRALSGIRDSSKNTAQETKAGLTGWALGITAINQAYQFLTSSIGALKNTLKDAVQSSTSLEVLRANFKGSAEDIELFRKATADTVSEANLIRLSNQASDLGVSLKQQALLFALAEDAGDKYGTSVEDGFSRIIAATEGNTKGLKTLGIQKEVYERILKDLAKVHGGELQNLDAETQKQIQLEAIIKASGITLDDVKNKTKDSSDKIASLSVRVEEAKVKIGELVSKALIPLIDAFDNSGKTGKDFASVIIGVASVGFNLVPMLVQLKSAQALLATATTASTTALNANSVALGTNAAAGAGWLTKFGKIIGAGAIIAVGAGLGIAVGKLIDYIKYDLPEEINKAAEDAVKKVKTQNLPEFLKNNTRFVPGEGTIQLVSPEQKRDWTEIGKTASDILARIDYLTEANKKNGISVKDYKKNLQEIDRLQKLLSISDQNKFIDDQIKKITDKNKLYAITNDLTSEIYDNTKKQLDALLNNAKTDDDRLKIYQAIDSILDPQLERIQTQLALEKDGTIQKYKSLEAAKSELENLYKIATTDAQRLKIKNELADVEKQIDYYLGKEENRKGNFIQVPDLDSIKNFAEETKKANEDLARLRIESIGNEYEQEKAQIEAKYEFDKKTWDRYLEDKAVSEKDYNDAIGELEAIRQSKLNQLMKRGFSDGLSAAQSIANSLRTIIGSGNRFVEALSRALEIAQAIAEIINSINILGGVLGFFGGGAGAAAGAAATVPIIPPIPLKTGGSVENRSGKISYTSYSPIPKFAGGINDFIVPPGFPNDSFLMALTSGERANITPVNQVSQEAKGNNNTEKLLSGIYDRIGAQTRQIAALELKVSVINNAPDIDTQVRKNKRTENKLARAGVKFNE